MDNVHVLQPAHLFAANDSAASDPTPAVEADDRTAVGLVELTLKAPERVDSLVRDDRRQSQLVPQFLAISLVSFTIFGISATVVLNLAVDSGVLSGWPVGIPAARWGSSSSANLVIAYAIGLVAATGVCLPSFYFFGLLAGVRTTMLGVVSHALKGKATAAIALVGILPIYFAAVLGMIVFDVPRQIAEATVYLALVLPFVAGLWGVRSLYIGFMGLADTIPPYRRGRRECLLRRLVVAWCMLYTVVTPLMVYTLWNHLAH